MFRKLTLAAAAGAGYVLGAKAGHERYEQIEAKFREIAGMPAVQNATESVKQTASSVADSTKAGVNDKVESASGKAKEKADKADKADKGKSKGGADSDLPPMGTTIAPAPVVDLGATTPPMGSGPIVGAGPSGSAPDVV